MELHTAISLCLCRINHELSVDDVAEFIGLQHVADNDPTLVECLLFEITEGERVIAPRKLIAYIDQNPSVVKGTVTGRIEDWVISHVLDRTLMLPIPKRLQAVGNSLGMRWITGARVLAGRHPDRIATSKFMQALQYELVSQLSPTERGELLADLLLAAFYGE